MKIFTAKQIREIDAYTIKHEPVPSIDLMERAATALARWIMKRFDKKTPFLFIVGPGNNGGDGWALARLLYHFGYENLRFYLLKISDELSPDSEINRMRLIEETDIRIDSIEKEKDFPFVSKEEWIIDGLFGSGLSRPLIGLAKDLVDYINGSERFGSIAIDIPSGLFADNNTGNNGAKIRADYTLSFQFPKLAFLLADNESFIGDWQVLDIGLHPIKIEEEYTDFSFMERKEARGYIQPRKKFSHKGTFGHALIISGSYGMMGAATLACSAAVSSGAGLVTAHIPRLGYEIIQCAVPEALISLDESDIIFTEVNNLEKYNALAIGPGLNQKKNTSTAIFQLLENSNIPLVIDADALNIIGENKDWLKLLPKNSILTPHPKEFSRLYKDCKDAYSRLEAQIEFSKKYKVILILKGAYTSISTPEGKVTFNSTGNPGMATGGSGDVLTGIIVSLLAQGYSSESAAKLGVFVHGLAGDLALNKHGYHALTPSRIIESLGKAFKKLES